MATERAELLKGLKARRSTFKSQITRFRKALDAYTDISSLEELKFKTERLVTSFDAYNEIQSELDAMDDVTEHLNERYDIEDSYAAVIARSRTLIREGEATSSHAMVSNTGDGSKAQSIPRDENEIQLPRIQLPTFSGIYEDWPGFADQFKATVHDNKQLTDSKRLTYLRSCLTGEAAKTIETLGTAASNYAIAWSILESRYDKPHIIINRHLDALFGMSKGLKPSYDEFTKYLNTAESHTVALKARGELTTDTILLYLLSTKMDPVTELKWREKAQTQYNLTLSDLFNFIQDQRCLVLPSGQDSRTNSKPSPPIKPYGISNARGGMTQTRTNDRDSRPQARFALASIAKPRCNICKEEHYTSACKKLENATTEQRRDMIKGAKLCSNCLRPNHIAKDCRSSTCRKCNAKHHTLLHEDPRPSTSNTQANVTSLSAQTTANGLLSTAIVDVTDKFGQTHACRALIDPGSQSHFLSKTLAQKLQLDRKVVNVPVQGIHSMSKLIPESVTITIQSRRTDFTINIDCLVLDTLNHILPARYINRKHLEIPKTIKLADPRFHKPGPIDLIIGADIYHEFISTGKISLANNSGALLKTKFGWIIIGRMHDGFPHATICNLSTHALDQTIKKFWEIEEAPMKKLFSDEEAAAENHYNEHTRRDAESGKYIVRLPFKEQHALGDSYVTALKRFYSLERNLAKNTDRKQLYVDFMNEYAVLGHMSEKQNDNKREGYYLPHHAVFKENSLTTKLRVVFDGSARTASGKSLNDTLMVGPTIQDDLFALTIRFRSHTYVLTADITKMYRQTWIHPDDRQYQKILWRDDPTKPVKTYTLNTVTYGTSAAPFLAIRSLHQLADDEASQFPRTATILKTDFYVDDLLTGARTYHEAESIRDEVVQLAKKGGLELRKWASNDSRLIRSSEPRLDNTIVRLDATKTTSILGILWNPSHDSLNYTLKPINKITRLTKRTILSQIAQLFDPLGLIGPVIVWAKLLMQQLWQLRVNWDECVPMDIATAWERYREQLPFLQNIEIPRETLVRGYDYVELHGFCDASEKAYGSCIYLRSTNRQGEITVRLVCSKSRVAPLKNISLPRLELCGAVLLSNLYSATTRALPHIKINKVYFWSDSTIVLSWINSSPHSLKTFVANRVAEIQSVTVASQWRHVPSLDNPADIISRSTMPAELQTKSMWYNGPSWLEHSEEQWPAIAIQLLDQVPEQRPVIACVTSINACDLLEKYSSITKTKRVIAYCCRYAHNSSTNRTQKPKLFGALSVEELESAMNSITKIEAILNSRPLTSLSSDPNDFNPLTPAHFLIGGPLTSIPEHDFRDTNVSRLSTWQHVQKMKQHFWTRWHKEYLHELTVRRKWHSGQTNDIPINTMVILHEDNAPPIRWPLGRITEVHPGEDGVIRVATVRTANGTYKRSIKKLSPLFHKN
ncbi:hypothetical protein ANTRET_LOCUS10340 [Anthophora retusa]